VAPVRPEAAPQEVLRPKAAAHLQASRRAWPAAETATALRKVEEAPRRSIKVCFTFTQRAMLHFPIECGLQLFASIISYYN
jgi:hypothetical protein